MDLGEFVSRAVDQTILALEEWPYLSHGTLPEDRWFRSGEAVSVRPRPVMFEHYRKWASLAGLVVPVYLNYLFREHRVTGDRFVLYRGDAFDDNTCYVIQGQLAFVTTEHIVIRVVRALIAALCESPDFAAWREKKEFLIRCPNGAVFSLYDHNGYPGFLRMGSL